MLKGFFKSFLFLALLNVQDVWRLDCWTTKTLTNKRASSLTKHHPSGLQEFPKVLVHASCSQLLQAVVAVDDAVSSHHHHPDAVGVLAKLAADGRAHDHVQAIMATTSVSVVMAGEDRPHS